MNKNIIFLTSLFFLTCTITGCSQGRLNLENIADTNTISKTIGMITAYSGIGGNYTPQVVAITTLGSQYAFKGIEKLLDEREKQKAIDAANESLRNPHNNTVSWNSQQTRGETTASETRDNCREVKQTVFKNGKRYNATSTFCKDSNTGRMVPV